MNRTAQNTFFIFASRIGGKAISFVLIVLLTRYLGVEGYGKYALTFAFTNIFLYLAGLGLGTLLVRETAKSKEKVESYLANILFLKIFAAVGTLVLIVLSANLLKYPMEVRILIYIAGSAVIVQSFTGIFGSVFLGFQRMEYEGGLFLLMQSLILAAVAFCIWMKMSLSEIMGAYLLALLVAFFIGASIENRKFVKIKIAFKKNIERFLLKESIPFCATSFLTMITFNVDSVMLSKMLGFKEVGIYNAASKIVFLFGIIAVSISMAIFPYISEQWTKKKESAIDGYIKGNKYCLLFALPLTVGIVILAPRIIFLLYGQEYTPSVAVLRLLVFCLPFMFLNNLTGRTLGAIGQQKKMVVVSLVNVSTNVCLNGLLIPYFGIFGAVAATLVTYGVSFGMQQFYIYKYFVKRIPFKMVSKIVLFSLLMGVAVYFIQCWNWIASVGAGIFVFSFFVFVSGLINFRELFSLKFWGRNAYRN